MKIYNSSGPYGTVDRLIVVRVGSTYYSRLSPSGGVGVAKVSNLTLTPNTLEASYSEEIISSIIGERGTQLTQLYGVLFYRLIEGDKHIPWINQATLFQKNPGDFTAIHPREMESGNSYLFFARRALESTVRKRRQMK